MVYPGVLQPIRAFTRSMAGCGAREAKASVVLRGLQMGDTACWPLDAPDQPGHTFLPMHNAAPRR